MMGVMVSKIVPAKAGLFSIIDEMAEKSLQRGAGMLQVVSDARRQVCQTVGMRFVKARDCSERAFLSKSVQTGLSQTERGRAV